MAAPQPNHPPISIQATTVFPAAKREVEQLGEGETGDRSQVGSRLPKRGDVRPSINLIPEQFHIEILQGNRLVEVTLWVNGTGVGRDFPVVTASSTAVDDKGKYILDKTGHAIHDYWEGTVDPGILKELRTLLLKKGPGTIVTAAEFQRAETLLLMAAQQAEPGKANHIGGDGYELERVSYLTKTSFKNEEAEKMALAIGVGAYDDLFSGFPVNTRQRIEAALKKEGITPLKTDVDAIDAASKANALMHRKPGRARGE